MRPSDRLLADRAEVATGVELYPRGCDSINSIPLPWRVILSSGRKAFGAFAFRRYNNTAACAFMTSDTANRFFGKAFLGRTATSQTISGYHTYGDPGVPSRVDSR